MPEIRILLADDHNVLRQGVAQLIDAQPDMQVVAQAQDGKEAVQMALKHQPDVALLDIHMPGMDGVEATREIGAKQPETRIIILTMYKLDKYVFEAIKAGANGYLLKEVEMETLLEAVRAVARGESVLDPVIASLVLAEFRPKETSSPGVKKQDLPHRDVQILSLLGQGLSNIEIANQLSISEKTVRNRLSQVFKKLHLKNRTQAALFAKKEGFTGDTDH